MLSVSLAPMPYAASGGAPPAPMAAALAAVPGQSALTAQAALPAIGAPITGNQRRPGGEAATLAVDSAASPESTNTSFSFASSASGRLFGNSSAFLTQLLAQTDAADPIQFQPSSAGDPPPPRPMFDLAALGTRAESGSSTMAVPQPASAPIPSLPANQNQNIAGQNIAAQNIAESAPAMPRPDAPSARPETPLPAGPDRSLPVRAKAGGAYNASQQRLSALPQTPRPIEPVDGVA